MKLKRILAGVMAATLFAVQPVQVVQADEETNVTQETDAAGAETAGEETPDAEKTAEQIAEEEKARVEAEKKASLETPADTNSLENWPEGPSVYAQSAVVMDMESGAILYAKKPDERHYPASITKLLTTLVALENAELTDKVTFSQASVDILNWDDASIGMRPGEEISMKDALYAVLLASANEVSYAVAESTGQNRLNGGYDTFIQMMNERAKELGCTGSNWVNPNGLHDENHYTTAHDMALIASAVYQEETFQEIMKTYEYRVPPTNLEKQERVFQQNHRMLWDGTEHYYEYCKGGKTGYTDQAMTTLVTMADNGDMQLAAVVLYDYGADAYRDTRAMMDYVFDNFEKVPVSDLEKSDEIKNFMDEGAYVVLPKEFDTSEVVCTVTAEEGTEGEAVYTYQGQVVGSTDVTVKKSFTIQEENVVSEDDGKNQGVKKEKNIFAVIGFVAVGSAGIFFLVFLRRYRRYKKLQARRRRQRSINRSRNRRPGNRRNYR